jgi:hypothetical protein
VAGGRLMAGRVRSLPVTDTRRRRLFRADMMKDAERAAAVGWSIPQLAEYWGVNQRTVYKWQERYPSTLGAALKKGARDAEQAVASSLFNQAVGRVVRSEVIEPMLDSNGTPMVDPATGQPLTRVKRTYWPPSVVAGIFYSCNRWPDRWKNVQRVQIEGGEQTVRNLVLVLSGNGSGAPGEPVEQQVEQRIELTALDPAALPAPGGNGHGGNGHKPVDIAES